MSECDRREGGRNPADGKNNNRRGGRDSDRRQQDERSQYIERVVTINRVSEAAKGGRRFSFTALVIIGDGEGTVNVGYGKAREVPAAIQKGVEETRKNFFRIPMIAGTITYPAQGETVVGIVLPRPTAPGVDLITGDAVRLVLECAGVQDVLSRLLGTNSPVNTVYAIVDAPRQLVRPEGVATRRGKSLEGVTPACMLRVRAGQGAWLPWY